MRPRHPIVIVGASVAGLVVGYRLAREGVAVHVYDAQPTFAPDPRTLIVTPAWLRLLDLDVEEAVLNRTHAFQLISRGASARIRLKEPDVILERARFLRLLARAFRQAGGRLTLGHRLEEMDDGASSPRLQFRNGRGSIEVAAPTVLGADGAHSVVAQEIGRDGLDRVALVQARVPLPPDYPASTVRVWFDRRSTRFFFWLIPESARTGAAGLIADTPSQARAALERFLTAQDLEPMAYQAATVPLYPFQLRPRPADGDGRVLLVGDAAGQVKVTTVGGVVTGMRGAAAAARAILNGSCYRDELRTLHWELNAHALVRRMLDGFTDEDYDRLLRSLNERVLHTLERYHRDELTRILWRLLPSQPRWLFLGTRGLVRTLPGRP